MASEGDDKTGWFSPVMLGFWLGGAGMGTGGCVLGAFMPYHHPVAVANSILWWGIYFGAFGVSVCALVGLLIDRTPPRPAAMRDGTVPTELEGDGSLGRESLGNDCRPPLPPEEAASIWSEIPEAELRRRQEYC